MARDSLNLMKQADEDSILVGAAGRCALCIWRCRRGGDLLLLLLLLHRGGGNIIMDRK